MEGKVMINKFGILDLPNEVISIIFQSCNLLDIATLTRTCRRFKNIIEINRINLPKAHVKEFLIEQKVMSDTNAVKDEFDITLIYAIAKDGKVTNQMKNCVITGCNEYKAAFLIKSCSWKKVKSLFIDLKKKTTILYNFVSIFKRHQYHRIDNLYLKIQGAGMRESFDDFLSSLRNVESIFINKICLRGNKKGFDGKIQLPTLQRIEIIECRCTKYCNEKLALPLYHQNKGDFNMVLCVNKSDFKLKLIRAAAEQYAYTAENEYKNDVIALTSTNPKFLFEVDNILSEYGLTFESHFDKHYPNCTFANLCISRKDDNLNNNLCDPDKPYLTVSMVAVYVANVVSCGNRNR